MADSTSQISNLKSQISVAGRLEAVKGLWGELLLLLERSAEEDPLTEQTGGLDKAIEPLMRNVEGEMRELRAAVAAAHAQGGPGAALERNLADFEEQLRSGVQIMSARLTARGGELAAQREQLKERLLGLKRKRQGAQSYRSFTPERKILDSSI